MTRNVILPAIGTISRCKRQLKFGMSLALALAMFTGLQGTTAADEVETELVRVESAPIVTGLAHPWGLDFLDDGSAIITERGGRLSILTPERQLLAVAGVPEVANRGQGGLLDIAVSPGFAEDGLIYFSFSEPDWWNAGTAVARGRLVRSGGAASLENVETIFSMEKKTRAGRHFGSRIVFHPDGTLFVTTGDRGDADRAQDFSDSAGAVIRINPDGTVPPDNPFSGEADKLSALWSKGHRNPQGATWDPVTGALWTVEHGARGGDEINRPQAGKNYGWPIISYGRHYSGGKIGVGTEAPGYEQPEYYWDPSIAPSGMAVYQGDMFPEWRGDFLVGALKFQLLARLDRNGKGEIVGEERMFEGKFGRIRDVNIAPDGSIWLLTDEGDGAVVRITRAP